MADALAPGPELKAQWQNPGDIFSLLLLVGGDVVQKSIAQLVGVRFKLPGTSMTFGITPVPFSFGWVAYAFTSLAAVLGDHRLMPPSDTDIQVVNCETGYARSNSCWVLGRLLRDHEHRVGQAQRTEQPPIESTGNVSLLIEIFSAQRVTDKGPRPSATWWSSWALIIAQQIFAAAPWIKWGYWSPFLITICGTFLGILTASLPQWTDEKWPGAKLTQPKSVALTRGNGHRYIMIIISEEGAWDLESMAASRLKDHPSTQYILTFISLLWVILLLTVTGMKQYTWFLVGVGASGSIWQTWVAAKSSSTDDSDIHLEPWHDRPTITGYQYTFAAKKALKDGKWKTYTDDDAKDEYNNDVTETNVRDVMGALVQLEKCVPKAGASLLAMFFPGGIDYEPVGLHGEREKRFWKYAKGQKSNKKQAPTTVV